MSSALVPRLRFPEFRNVGPWELRSLGQFFEQRLETGAPALPLLSVTEREGVIPQEQTNRRDSSSKDKTKYLRVVPGDIAYNTMRMWEGRSAFVPMEGLVSPAYTVCKPLLGTDGLFFSYAFKTRPLIAEFRRYSQGLVKDTLNLKYDAFAKIKVASPSLPEQKKIAQCLTSLDELIAAESRKLDALQAFKNGLLLHVFTREGETAPRLRFPEFVELPLRSTTLAEVTAESKARNHHPLEGTRIMGVTKADGIVPMDERIIGSQVSRYKLVKRNWFAYNPMRLNIGSIARWSGLDDILVSPDYIVFRCLDAGNDGIEPSYLDHYRRSAQWTSFFNQRGDGSVRIRFYYKDLSRLRISLPSIAEQKRIASILSSFDNLITAQSQKLAALKHHKQGLMQGLFPRAHKNGL